MSKLPEWKKNEIRGLDALKRRTAAAADIIRLAVKLVATPTGPARVAAWEPFEEAVRQYNLASVQLKAAQDAVSKAAMAVTAPAR